jgi:hypothetical protein
MCQAYVSEARFVVWVERSRMEEHERGEHDGKPAAMCPACRGRKPL